MADEYVVQWNYVSGLGGPWRLGDRVNLDREQADSVQRDSPGVLLGPLAQRPDDLTAVAGIGEQIAHALFALGILTYQQLAEADARELAAALVSKGQLVDVQAPAGEYADDEAVAAALLQARAGVVQFWQAQLAQLLAARQDRQQPRRQSRGGGETINRDNFKATRKG